MAAGVAAAGACVVGGVVSRAAAELPPCAVEVLRLVGARRDDLPPPAPRRPRLRRTTLVGAPRGPSSPEGSLSEPSSSQPRLFSPPVSSSCSAACTAALLCGAAEEAQQEATPCSSLGMRGEAGATPTAAAVAAASTVALLGAWARAWRACWGGVLARASSSGGLGGSPKKWSSAWQKLAPICLSELGV